MSKVDALRAMREEKYARLQAGAKARPAPTPAVAPPAADKPATAKATASKPAAGRTAARKPPAAGKPAQPAAEPVPSADACGHKSMNGRACTREAGHPQKSHRYS